MCLHLCHIEQVNLEVTLWTVSLEIPSSKLYRVIRYILGGLWFSESLQVNPGALPLSCQDSFLPRPLKFIIHQHHTIEG